VDTELFHESSKNTKKSNSALAFYYHSDQTKANQYAQKYGLFLRILEREIPHKELPQIFKEHEYYIDQTEIPSLSKTALEALACGLKVIRWDGKLVEKLPTEHKPENVAKKVWEIYRQLKKKYII
jgi:hypothetical protein